MDNTEVIAKLEVLSSKLDDINKNLKPTRWKLFVQGLWRAVGYLIGIIITVALLGWMLKLIGVIPLFQDIATKLGSILEHYYK
jgi:hypothetical protein